MKAFTGRRRVRSKIPKIPAIGPVLTLYYCLLSLTCRIPLEFPPFKTEGFMKYLNIFTHRFPLAAHRWLLAAVLSLAFTASAQLNYDTAWTYVYDGGGTDRFCDVKYLPSGVCV
jgi:hypothetical protein